MVNLIYSYTTSLINSGKFNLQLYQYYFQFRSYAHAFTQCHRDTATTLYACKPHLLLHKAKMKAEGRSGTLGTPPHPPQAQPC